MGKRRNGIWLVAAMVLLGFFSCKKQEIKKLGVPSAKYNWVHASTKGYVECGSGFALTYFDTTSNDTDQIYSYRICRSIRLFGNQARITTMDSSFNIDVGGKKIYEEVSVPLPGGNASHETITPESDSLPFHYRIQIGPDSNRASAMLEFIEVGWDTLTLAGARPEIRERLYLKGGESDFVMKDIIKRRVLQLGLWDQYLDKGMIPNFHSHQPRFDYVLLVRHWTELIKQR